MLAQRDTFILQNLTPAMLLACVRQCPLSGSDFEAPRLRKRTCLAQAAPVLLFRALRRASPAPLGGLPSCSPAAPLLRCLDTHGGWVRWVGCGVLW